MPGFAVYYRYPNSQRVTYGQFIKVGRWITDNFLLSLDVGLTLHATSPSESCLLSITVHSVLTELIFSQLTNIRVPCTTYCYRTRECACSHVPPSYQLAFYRPEPQQLLLPFTLDNEFILVLS